ncbi:MAG: tRNA (adenosine(37)-N6)-dimethylallyltransferase MiaA [Chlamydiota bacterium]|nr:tRNA (adenosine(37)-N6)-dimethylallyltransferase MiaA [Chlamydiota bacterium]
MIQKIRPIYLVGPTGIGKTKIALQLANKISGEIISADAMQVYRSLDIGTDKPTLQERCDIPHHLIDVVDISESFNVAIFVSLAKSALEDICKRGKLPIVVGGTGLYVRSLIDGIFDAESFANVETDRDVEVRKRLVEYAHVKGYQALHQRLCEVDPEAAKAIHPHNVRRVIRALEVFENTGLPISGLHQQWKNPDASAFIIGFNRNRKILYQDINLRVDAMFDKGLVQEVSQLAEQGLESNKTVMQAIGYKEIIACLRGEFSEDEARDLIKRNSRRLAKRQLTWFRRDSRIQWIDLDHVDVEETIHIIIGHYKRSYTVC